MILKTSYFFFDSKNLETNSLVQQTKSISNPRAIASTGICTNSYGGAYANWWTYSILLLNWFILFCFVLYLINRFNLTKTMIIITIIFNLLSFMMIVAFAILWGIQCMLIRKKKSISFNNFSSLLDQDILQIPLVVVIIGCIASLLFLINILILVTNRTRGE